MPKPSHDRLQGKILDNQYRVLRLIEKGGMGVVYEGQQQGLKRKVALKVLSPKIDRHLTRFQRFKREAETVATLSHPNIVQVFNFFIYEGLPVIAMEYVDGTSLSRVLEAEGPLDSQRVATIGLQVLSALEATHEANIVHRDIKPANVILTELPGLGEWVKMVDFGIALMVDEEDMTRITKEGEVVGTPTFMAPEQLLGGDVDQRTDIYSLGATMFMALSGRPPFPVKNFEDLLEALLEQPSPQVKDVMVYAPVPLARVVVRALSKNPAERYDSAREMTEALESALSEGGERPSLEQTLTDASPIPQQPQSTAQATPIVVEDTDDLSEVTTKTIDIGSKKGYLADRAQALQAIAHQDDSQPHEIDEASTKSPAERSTRPGYKGVADEQEDPPQILGSFDSIDFPGHGVTNRSKVSSPKHSKGPSRSILIALAIAAFIVTTLGSIFGILVFRRLAAESQEQPPTHHNEPLPLEDASSFVPGVSQPIPTQPTSKRSPAPMDSILARSLGSGRRLPFDRLRAGSERTVVDAPSALWRPLI